MTPEERVLMMSLCSRIAQEKDMMTFMELVTELNNLLDGKKRRIAQSQPRDEN